MALQIKAARNDSLIFLQKCSRIRSCFCAEIMDNPLKVGQDTAKLPKYAKKQEIELTKRKLGITMFLEIKMGQDLYL